MKKRILLVVLGVVLGLAGPLVATIHYTNLTNVRLINSTLYGAAANAAVRTDSNGILTTAGSTNQFQTVNGCTVPTSAWATCTVNVTWPTAFPDVNYSVVCSGNGASGGFPSKLLINSVDRTSTTVTTITVTDAGNAGDAYAHISCFAAE